MAELTLLQQAKLALRKTGVDAFDDQINLLIDSAKLDLGIAGVTIPETLDAIVTQAIITYVQMHFGQPDEYDRLKRSYDEQKAQLGTATGYTEW